MKILVNLWFAFVITAIRSGLMAAFFVAACVVLYLLCRILVEAYRGKRVK